MISSCGQLLGIAARSLILITLRVRLFLLSIIALAGGCSEMVESSYATYADAERAGAVGRGWVPAFVPRSATAIREAHDLDTNDQWLRFRLPDGDTLGAVGAVALPLNEARLSTGKPPAIVQPWLAELRDPPLITARAGIRTYRHPDAGLGARCVALDLSAAEAYVWSC
jgi:hypothetical protein